MNYYLSLAALVPVVLLFIRVYRLDRIEKEPRVLLGKLIGFGALAAVPPCYDDTVCSLCGKNRWV